MAWLDKLPWSTLLMATAVLGLAPFVPEPHLVEKLRMLMNGELSKPIDIIDLLMHGGPAILLGLKFLRTQTRRSET